MTRLRYVQGGGRGIHRVKNALGFKFVAPDGRTIRSAKVLKRIRALAIPPAWTDVWICTDPCGHLQATGRDARGRKQYRYHPEWRAMREETKFDRLQAFAAALPRIRARTAADLARPGLPREKVLAAVVQLLEKSLIRIGNEEYVRSNGSFGLTTFRDKHAEVSGSRIHFDFRGKSGKRHSVDVNDPRLARIVKNCRDLPGQELFQYIDENGKRCDVNSADVNAYLKEISGQDFTAKDFRTWSGTVLAAVALRELRRKSSSTPAQKHVLRAVEAVAGVLGNTPAVCRRAYIHPAIFNAYLNGSMDAVRARRNGRRAMALREEEVLVVAVLKKIA